MNQAIMYTFPNQKIVEVVKTPCKGATLFAQYDMEAFLHAAQALDAGAFKLWCYLGMNQDGYVFALSSKDAKNRFGLKKAQYDNAVEKLIGQGYLVNKKGEGTENLSNYWYFKDVPDQEARIEASIRTPEIPSFETEPDLHESMTTSQSEDLSEELLPCSETKQGLYGKDAIGCFEPSRSSVGNQTRNNINNTNSISIEYGSKADGEEEKRIYLDSKRSVPYSKEILSDDSYIDRITSVSRNYRIVKEAFGEGDIADGLKDRYDAYIARVDNGYMSDLFPMS